MYVSDNANYSVALTHRRGQTVPNPLIDDGR